MATEEATQLAAEEAMGEETGLLDKMSASSVGVQGIGLEIALQLVPEVAVEVYYLHVLGLEELEIVGIVLVEIVIDTWMIAMMEDAMVTGIVLKVETSMGGVIAMLVTGTHHPMEIDLLEIGTVGQIAMHRMAMEKTEAMIGMVVHEGAMIGMEVEGLNAMIGAATETGQDLMTAPAEEDTRLLLSATNGLLVVSVIKLVDLCCILRNQFEQSVM